MEALKEESITHEDVQLKQKDKLLKPKDDRLAQYVVQVQGLQLGTLALSRDLHALAQKCQKLEDEQIFAHLDHHAERTKLNQTLK
ncbi:hypothetical protein HDU81_002623 [Chytriomyces hyalinus]|nr:hypothetical protein HDU81_002623 [Chytriomyces hyalinus]